MAKLNNLIKFNQFIFEILNDFPKNNQNNQNNSNAQDTLRKRSARSSNSKNDSDPEKSSSDSDEDNNNNNNQKENEENIEGEEEESEIVITSEQFKLKLKKIFGELNNYLKKNKTNLREFFNSQIFRPTFDDPSMEYNEDAIFLKPLIDMLKAINISLDTVDIYCVYTRLKIVENSEAVSINILEKELNNLDQFNEILDSVATNVNNIQGNDIDNYTGNVTGTGTNINANFNESIDKQKSKDPYGPSGQGPIEAIGANSKATGGISGLNKLNNRSNSYEKSPDKDVKNNFSDNKKNEIKLIEDSDTESDPVDFDDLDSNIEYSHKECKKNF